MHTSARTFKTELGRCDCLGETGVEHAPLGSIAAALEIGLQGYSLARQWNQFGLVHYIAYTIAYTLRGRAGALMGGMARSAIARYADAAKTPLAHYIVPNNASRCGHSSGATPKAPSC